ncbi:cytochrome c oxidase subunit II [Histidinibacterium lentulum]|uniref:Cytochrome aa3 subunit 2 n=1 Tax=Histidinibacterium lentulum TaxID=2480588 RepID=A0A3N2R8Q8_9RHOB|nr:cytochrome c oxidase subunit II [Histidinibacterium lentulum]ROU03771.1 cytochrome c oxidase subunit II [Histidinibacterium lentulum]
MTDRADSTLGVFGAQSSLLPAGEGAAAALGLTNAMTLGGAAIFVIVMAFVWLAWRRQTGGRTWWILGGGVVFPLVVLALLFVASTGVLRAVAGGREDAALTIEVTGHQFWWDVVYDPGGLAIRDANEVVMPVGVPVRIVLKSEDVIHSFWVPKVAGKMDMIPGRVNETVMTATEAGRFRGQCAEFCGLSHPLMAFEMVAVPPDHFRAFLEDLQGDAADVAGPAARGREVFLEAGCAACHAVRGVAEGARLGPDLTRVGGRAALGAGMWPMNEGSLAGWIADVQDMKPGANMPSYAHLSGPDLRALAQWLGSLR